MKTKYEYNQLLLKIRQFIYSEYSCEKSQALDGHPVAKEAREIWDELHEFLIYDYVSDLDDIFNFELFK